MKRPRMAHFEKKYKDELVIESNNLYNMFKKNGLEHDLHQTL